MAIDIEILKQAKHDKTAGHLVLDDGMTVPIDRIAGVSGDYVIASVKTGHGTGVLRKFTLQEIAEWKVHHYHSHGH